MRSRIVKFAQAVDNLRQTAASLDAQILRRVWGSEGYDDRHLDPGELSTRVHLNVDWLLAALTDPSGDPEQIRGFADVAERAEEIGSRRALQGVGIDAVIGSWRTAEQLIEQRLVGLSGDVDNHELLEAIIKLGNIVGALTDRSVHGYRRVQQEVTSHYDRLTIDLVARIVTNAGLSASEVQQRAAVVGADAEADYAAVAIGFDPAIEERATWQTQREILGYIGQRAPGRVLIGSLDDNPLLLVPTGPAHLPDLQGMLISALQRGKSTAGKPVIGLAARTCRLAAAHDVAHQARMAVEVGVRLARHGEVVTYREVAVEALLLRSPDTTQLLVEQLAPISGRPELLATLRTWLDAGQSAREAARRLYVHPNTVPHRLRAIGRLLERPLDGRDDDLLDLRLALRALELSH
jgi:PucR C-terminal helix-turn-helix domain/GGDEF-like domain